MSRPYIVGVALKMRRGTVYSADAPKRHGDVIHDMRAAGESVADIAEAEQGFVTNERNFVSRQEATAIAGAAGQIAHWFPPIKRELFSEDVW